MSETATVYAAGSSGVAARPEVAAARRVVLKVGTRVLTHDDGRLALSRLFALVEAAVELRNARREVLIVTSGAVGLGKEALGLSTSPSELSERQACAAVGQARLMALYLEGFERLGARCAQVLLGQGDFDDRTRYLNLRATLLALLGHGVIPVINENDAVSTEELALVEDEARPIFGDNDRLSALVATELGADLLVLLTDVDGVFDRDPRVDQAAQLMSRVDDPEAALAVAGGPRSAASRGGMRSKVESAAMAVRSACHVVIASGRMPGVAHRVLAGENVGTWFVAQPGLPARRRWIAFATALRGTLHLDEGAVSALRERGASLLAPGIVRAEGEFRAGDVVALKGPNGESLGRGQASVDADTVRKWTQGERPSGTRNRHAVVARENLVLES